jgi:hypothetical protein
MKLYCTNEECGYEFLVHSGHYWRYPSRVGKCRECGSRAVPDEGGLATLRSRNREVSQTRSDLVIKIQEKIEENV